MSSQTSIDRRKGGDSRFKKPKRKTIAENVAARIEANKAKVGQA